MPRKHNCGSTGTVKKNCIATNHWVCDRVIEWLSKDATLGPTTLKKKLEEKYRVDISAWVVWDGKEMALKKLQGDWENSFDDAFSFKGELEMTNPGSIVDIEFELDDEGKYRFSKMFIALRACVDGFLNGCRPYVGVDATTLNWKWRGQLASAIAIDGHNWMFPVAYGVFGSETSDSWAWFFERLHMAIGSPHGLVISTDAGKGIDAGVTQVFTNGVEHRECMRHLVKNFTKKFHGEVF